MRALGLLAVGALLCACPQDVTVGADVGPASDLGPAPDADPPDLGRGSPDVPAGGAPDAIADAGALPPDEDASTPGDATPDAGASPVSPVRWSELVLPPNTRELNAVWGRSPTDVYAGSGGGFLYRFDGVAWRQVWRTPTNEGIHDITGDATRVYVVGQTSAYALDLSPAMTVTTAARFSARRLNAVIPMTGPGGLLVGLEETTEGVLARWEGTTITDVHRPIMVRSVLSLLADGPDTYYFGGSFGSIHTYARGSVSRELVSLPVEWDLTERASMDVRGLARVGNALYAVGHAHLILRRDMVAGVPTWEVVYRGAGAAGEDLRAIAGGWILPTGVGPVEAYAVGDALASGGIVRWDGITWAPVNATDQWMLTDIWRANADQYFAVGYRRNGIAGVVLRGER